MGGIRLVFNWDFMEHAFYISNKEQKDIVFQCSIYDLLHDQIRIDYLVTYGQGIRATNDQVTVMYTAGWLGYLCGGIHFFNMLQKKPGNNDPHLQVFRTSKGKYWISFYIDEDKIEILEEDEPIGDLYKSYITPIMSKLSREVGLPLIQLWYQFYHSLYWVKHRIQHSVLDSLVKERFACAIQDFQWNSSPVLFELNKHPLQKPFHFVDNPWDMEDPLPLKPSCCLAHQAEDRHTCYTCPRMDPEIREAKKLHIIEKLNRLKEA